MKKLFFLLSALCLSMSLAAQNPPPATGGGKAPNDNCGMLYGKNHVLTFCAPEDWLLDNSLLNDQGIYAVFYPEKSTFVAAKENGTFMYFNVIGKHNGETTASFMKDDADQVNKNAAKAVVSKGSSIQIGDREIPTLFFAPGGFNRWEAVAYIEEEKVFVMAVLSSKNEATFKRDFPQLGKLLASYKFMGSDVTIQQK